MNNIEIDLRKEVIDNLESLTKRINKFCNADKINFVFKIKLIKECDILIEFLNTFGNDKHNTYFKSTYKMHLKNLKKKIMDIKFNKNKGESE